MPQKKVMRVGYISTTTHGEVGAIVRENTLLKAEVARLERLVEALSVNQTEDVSPEGAAMVANKDHAIQDVESAKQAILGLLDVGHVFTYSDLAAKLDIDLELLVEACDALAREGKVGETRSAA